MKHINIRGRLETVTELWRMLCKLAVVDSEFLHLHYLVILSVCVHICVWVSMCILICVCLCVCIYV